MEREQDVKRVVAQERRAAQTAYRVGAESAPQGGFWVEQYALALRMDALINTLVRLNLWMNDTVHGMKGAKRG